jgi:hypothetical protein
VRDFFLKYQERILYGTDIGAKAMLNTPELGIELGESRVRVDLVRSFLEKEGPFRLNIEEGYLLGKFDGDLHRIRLPQEALEKIYFRNFERLVATQPCPIDHHTAAAECQRLVGIIPMMAAASPGLSADTHVVEMVGKNFMSL